MISEGTKPITARQYLRTCKRPKLSVNFLKKLLSLMEFLIVFGKGTENFETSNIDIIHETRSANEST